MCYFGSESYKAQHGSMVDICSFIQSPRGKRMKQDIMHVSSHLFDYIME
jgi:hypothetical protein